MEMEMLNYRLEYLNAENESEVIRIQVDDMQETEKTFIFRGEDGGVLFMLPTNRLICIKRLDD